MSKSVTVVIPTLQKNVEILSNLIDSLDKDTSVTEIILIDNSLKGFVHSSTKLKVITPNENMYVNPSWNLGVEQAKNEIVALFNDDIIIADDFCKDVIELITPKMGIVGMNQHFIKELPDSLSTPPKEKISLEKASYMDHYFGIVMFFYKTSYNKIPDNIKICYGDSWIFTRSQKYKHPNYRINGCTIYHYGSLSSDMQCLNPIVKQDSLTYKHMTVKWYNRLFSYENLWDYYRFRILGISIRLKK